MLFRSPWAKMRQSLRTSKRSLLPPTQREEVPTGPVDSTDDEKNALPKPPEKRALRVAPQDVKASTSASANTPQNPPWAKARNSLRSTIDNYDDINNDDSISNDVIFDHVPAADPSSEEQQEVVESNPEEAFGGSVKDRLALWGEPIKPAKPPEIGRAHV